MPHKQDPIGDNIPTWGGEDGALSGVRSAISQYGSFRNAVIAFVATWIVSGILDVGRIVVGSVLLAFDAVVLAFDGAAAALVGALQSVGLPVLDLASGVSAFVVGLAGELGPFAPVVAGAVVTILIVGTYRFGKAILLEIPILGGFLEFLGVDL